MFLFSQSTHRMVIRYNPAIGHLYVPDLQARIPNETGGFRLATNSLGFRSDFGFEAARGASPRILLFGDSYTAGDNCPNEDRFSDRLASLLGAEVYNYGLSGSGLDQQLLIWREFARGVEADLIVLCVQVDSIRRIQMHDRPSIDRRTGRPLLVPKPYFTLQDGALSLHNVPVPLERTWMPEQPAGQPNGSGPGLLKWYRESAQLDGFRRWIREDMPRLQSEIYRLSRTQPYPEFRSGDPGWNLMRALLAEFIREAGGRPVLIAPVPTYHFFLHGAAPLYQRLFAGLEDPGRGVHVLDLTTPLARLPWKNRQNLCFRFDTHFSPYGHQQVAGLMAESIRDRKLLPAGAPAARPRQTAVAKPRKDPGSIYVLGLSCFYHNSAACLIRDGAIVAAAEEERFTRLKNDRRFPHRAANYCLEEGGVDPRDLSAVVYYDNTALTFERILHSLAAVAGRAQDAWLRILPSWLRYKLHVPELIRRYLHYEGLVLQEIHHRSHCASAFYPSPYTSAAILTIDGVGEWATASIGVGRGSQVRLLEEMHFPHSLGLLYSAFTQFTGFKVNSGEYKMMGLAPYGEPKYVDLILRHLVDLKPDGSVELNLEYFDFLHRPSMTGERFAGLFGGPARQPESRITRREIDIARSIQVVTEESMLRMARHAHKLTGEKFLCLAGGVALNCVANGRLLRESPFEDIWIQPAAGDSGCALGAALDVYHSYFGKDRATPARSLQGGSYLGPKYSSSEIEAFLETHGYPYRKMTPGERTDFLARSLEAGKVVGHFSGRLEFGPRSLGSRSILGDARSESMQMDLNLRIKYRESFRPFAPSVLAGRVSDYFDLDRQSPYMLIVAPVKEQRRLTPPPVAAGDDLLPVVRQARSDLPAITHVDYSARIQTVDRADHPAYYDLIQRFEALTGCAVIVNTSFNVRGEPIVCTPEDAYRCFMRTEMNILALEDYVLLKEEQPPWPEGKGEGLESEDASRPSAGDQPRDLLRRLESLFHRSFLPLAKELSDRGQVLVDPEFRRLPSTWSAYQGASTIREIFEFPPALENAAADPKAFARGLLKDWPEPQAALLGPFLEKLVKLGLDHPIPETLQEEVSDSVYVMF